MSNTPSQQAELYRKAAETIEMCAEHGIEPMVRVGDLKKTANVCSCSYCCDFEEYEFPLAVVEGQLVWEGDELYSPEGKKFKACKYETMFHLSSWTPPKQPLCEVEGKPVYKGDKLYLADGISIIAKDCLESNGGFVIYSNIGSFYDYQCSWNPPKRTVMVELTVNDAESFRYRYQCLYPTCNNIQSAIDKALDNLK